MTTVHTLVAICALLAVMVISTTILRGWQGWLSFKNRELEMLRQPKGTAYPLSESGTRIELSDLKERIRKLEAIASGVDL